jgi:hypothetical protein
MLKSRARWTALSGGRINLHRSHISFEGAKDIADRSRQSLQTCDGTESKHCDEQDVLDQILTGLVS